MDVRYLLEWEVDGAVQRAITLPRAAEVDIGLVPPDTRRFGLAGRPTKQHTPYRDIPITIRGRSGLARRAGEDRRGAALEASGPELFRELVAFLRDFQEYAATHESAFVQRHKVNLIFRAVWENEHHYVHLVRFDQHRDVEQSRFSYTWTAEFKTDGPADARPQVETLAERAAASRLKRSTSSSSSTPVGGSAAAPSDAARGSSVASRQLAPTLDDFIDAATTKVGEISAELSTFRAPLQAVIRAAVAARRFAAELREVTVEFPRDLVLDVFKAADEAALAFYETWDALPIPRREVTRPALVGSLALIQRLRMSTLEWLGARGEKARGQSDRAPFGGIGAGVAVYRGTLVAEHVVGLGESIQDVAFEVLGDRSRWPEIAALNGMPNPRELRDGSPLVPGVRLRVPAAPGEGIGITSLNEDELFGRDWALGQDWDWIPVGDPPVDVAVTSGRDLLIQAIRKRASMLKGDNAVWPLAGVDRVVAESLTAEAVGYFAAHTRAQFLRDSRVAAVEGFELVDEDGSITASFAVVPVAGDRVPLKVPTAT